MFTKAVRSHLSATLVTSEVWVCMMRKVSKRASVFYMTCIGCRTRGQRLYRFLRLFTGLDSVVEPITFSYHSLAKPHIYWLPHLTTNQHKFLISPITLLGRLTWVFSCWFHCYKFDCFYYNFTCSCCPHMFFWFRVWTGVSYFFSKIFLCELSWLDLDEVLLITNYLRKPFSS